MPKTFIPPTIKLPEMFNSVTSEGSLSNFVAQTPKDHRPQNQYKKVPMISQKLNELKQNNSQSSNISLLDPRKKHQLPYKMVSSQLPAPCTNHPEKESSFYIQSDEKQFVFYCEKCAILVASQGFTVKKIQSTCESRKPKLQNEEPSSNRLSIKSTKTIKKSKMNENLLTKQQKETQLTNFLNKLQRIQTRMDKKFETNEDQIAEIETCGQNEQIRIKQVFVNLHRVLDQFEQFYYNDLESISQKLKQPFEQQIEELNNDSNTLQSMKQDIFQTYDDIINHTTSSEFQTVINVYKQNVENAENCLQQKQANNNNRNKALIKTQIKVQIQPEDIINALRKQIQSVLQPLKRLSVKGSQRRKSITGNQIR